ncbi:uncharacterized protein LOC114770503 [Denticeps clupeoides]|uniref:uncharacterized protein LOC114770503 n=1 Tax=Denticeps clupeoides TaxID=299321 RepID=UPI0010A4EA72|nr:uncharacterized protein LOC114770503 [Denticeps clupeoides]
MEERRSLRSIALFICLALTSAIDRLNEVEELRKIEFGHSFPRHGLRLLYWFARLVDRDANRALDLDFDPGTEHFGFHLYPNNRLALPDTRGHPDVFYYVVGNVNGPKSYQLPVYVVQDFLNAKTLHSYHRYWGLDFDNGNRDRIIVRVRGTSLEAVYVAAHFYPSNEYDLSHVYEISSGLLSRIGSSGLDEFLSGASSWVRFVPPPGFECFYYGHPVWYLGKKAKDEESALFDTTLGMCKEGEVKLEVKPVQNYARLSWSGIPKSILGTNLWVGLYLSNSEDNKNYKTYTYVTKQDGHLATSIRLNPRLQVRLFKDSYIELWRGPEFDNTNGHAPTVTQHPGASLQVVTRDGYACILLYVKKSFVDWRTVLRYSWVALYNNLHDPPQSYVSWQYVTKLQLDSELETHNRYFYRPSLYVYAGLHARLVNGNYDELGRTRPWK